MSTKSQRALLQLSIVLVIVAAAALVTVIWKYRAVVDIYLTDGKSVVLNGVIVLLFLLGLARLFQALNHYAREERQLERFVQARKEGVPSRQVLAADDDSLIARRVATVRELYSRGVPIDHGAIAAVMMAEESLYQSFPRFVNNVLILTGVFGTVTSLIIALVGASDVLQNTVPGEGLGVMLLGMNTALTTTATAIVCYFLFTFFYLKLTDVQTYLFSQIERAMLLYVVPEYVFEPEAINLQTKQLVNEVRDLVTQLRTGVGDVEHHLARVHDQGDAQIRRWDAALQGQGDQNQRIDTLLARIEQLRQVLREGFRLQ